MATEENPTYATAASVAGLASEVEGLRRTVDALRGLSGQVEDLARVVSELAERVATAAGRPSPVSAPSWLDLPADLLAAQPLLRDLVTWLGDVYLRYPDGGKSLPDCWLWHPDVVEELVWLWHAWLAAYRAEAATVTAAGDWHDRYRPGVVRRIKTVAGTCSLETHLPRGDRSGGRPVVPLAGAMAPIAQWWATRRTDTAPEPTSEQLATAAAQRRAEGARR